MPQDSPFPPDSHVAAYARDSGGPRQQASVQQQIDQYHRYCHAHDLVLIRTFTDTRTGTTTVGRHGFHAMMDYARQDPPPVAGFIIYNWDRFARDIKDAQYFRADLLRRGYKIHSLTDFIPDMAEEDQMMFMGMIDWKNTRRSKDDGVRIKRGLEALARRGYKWGIPPVGYRAKKVKIGDHRDGSPHIVSKWESDPETWQRVCVAWKKRLLGYTMREIHQATHLFQSTQSYSKFFRNPAYKGVLKCGELEFLAPWPAACTPDQWEAVQQMRRPHREGGAYPRRANSPYLLSGLATCGYCDAPMSGSCTWYTRKDATRVKWDYYVCADKQRDDWYGCESKILKAAVIEKAVLDTVLTNILTPDHISQLVSNVNAGLATRHTTFDAEVATYTNRLTELDRNIERLLDDAEAGGLHSVKERLAQREAERRQTRAELICLQQQRMDKIEYDEQRIRQSLARVRQTLLSEHKNAAQKLLRCVIHKLILRKEGGELHYHLPLPILFPNQASFLQNRLPIAKVEFSYLPKARRPQ